jgi:predicted small metal-binding protein
MVMQMKILKCSDLDPSSDCHFEATGDTNEEVIGKLFQHASEAHKDKLEGMSEDDKEGMTTKMNELLDKQE